jgi:hypothetical protein
MDTKGGSKCRNGPRITGINTEREEVGLREDKKQAAVWALNKTANDASH